jgi:putative heme-binding domain-containing protein
MSRAGLIIGVTVCSLFAAVNADESKRADVATTEPRTPEEERKSFRLPPGFAIELVAAEPYVRKPININFDSRGRRWGTESVEYPFAAEPGTAYRDSVRILEWRQGQPPAEEVTTFSGGLNIPIGVLPQRQGAIVYSIPHIYRFHDQDENDRADGRDVLYGPFGFKDTHGMTGEFTWGFDGWVYACHGYLNSSRVRGADGSEIEMNSGHVYRFRPDGSRVEHFTRGQVNPFGLAFDPLGNLYSCDCHSQPIYQLLRGAHYPSFSRPHDGLGFGPTMTRDDHGSTAIAGLAYYAADHFPPPYRDSVFIGNVLTNRVHHDRVVWRGGTPRAIRQPDFLTSDDPWFRPVDIKLGPDGALYIADFYNRIIGHYEVSLTHPGRDRQRGRIWRVVYRGPDGNGQPPQPPRKDWLRASIDDLIRDLRHPNLTVRMIATHELVERRDPEVVPAIRKMMVTERGPAPRSHGLWILERCGALEDSVLAAATRDGDAGVRIHALRILAERGQLSSALRESVIKALHDPKALVRRCAAEVLGTHPALENISLLLGVRHQVPKGDTHLLHVVRLALREQLKVSGSWDYVQGMRKSERDNRVLADVAAGVPGAGAAAFLIEHLSLHPERLPDRIRYAGHIARHGDEPTRARLFRLIRGDRGAPLAEQLALWQAIHQGEQTRGGALSASARDWGAELARQLMSSPLVKEVVAGIELAGTAKVEEARPIFLQIIHDPQAPDNFRTASLLALTTLDIQRAIPTLGRSLADPAAPLAIRERAANLLAEANRADATAELLRSLPTAPERLALPIARGLANSRSGTEQLLELVSAGKASARLLQDPAVQIRMSRVNLPQWRERLAELTRAVPTSAQRLQVLTAQRKAGFAKAEKDPAQGTRIFEKHCANCHQLANQGSRVAPQLDGIGARGFDRLLEDILDPSRNVDQGFRATTLGLADGRVVSGLVLREEGQALVIADEHGQEIRIPKTQVEERSISPLSPMPANLAEQIPEADFYHLMAYLLAQAPAESITGSRQR